VEKKAMPNSTTLGMSRKIMIQTIPGPEVIHKRRRCRPASISCSVFTFVVMARSE
jgi:hypothetical protein